MPLRQGDSILAIGGDDRISILRSSADFLLIQTDLSDQPTDWKKARAAICVGLVAIIASIAGVPVYLAMLGAAAIVILARLVSVEDAYRGMEWQAIVLIAGMYPLSTALVQTGLAQRLGALAVDFAAPFGPLGLVAGTFIFTALLTQLMAGQVTTLITAPIFISAAIHMKVNPQAVAVTAAIACSASFLTPLSHPVNSLMIGPGNYRFNDFFRAGWILTLLSFFMLLVGMKLFWGL
jgi:di/tricarboxylate transporter